MRYTEPKERCAELMRLTLGHMGRHEAGFNPLTFTVWYEHVAGINPPLSEAIDRLTHDAAHLDDEAVAQLYKQHVAPTDTDAMERIGGEMQRLMAGMAQSASHTGNQAGSFGAQLNGLSAALAAQDVAQIAPHLGEVLAGAALMKQSVDALQQQVTAGNSEIDRLRGDLERTRNEALLDPLTGILNRKGFDQKLQVLLAQPTANDTSHCLVMLDIDHFKQVNDLHGHLMGDRVIQAVGEILRTSLTDPLHAVARYGGEEFAILLPRTSRTQCVQVAEAVRLRTKALKIRKRNSNDVLLTVTISGGMTEVRQGDDATSLISRADAALYRSKHDGRDRLTSA